MVGESPMSRDTISLTLVSPVVFHVLGTCGDQEELFSQAGKPVAFLSATGQERDWLSQWKQKLV